VRSTRPGLTVEPFHLRPRPAEQLTALFAGGWPAFIEADAEAARHLPTVRATFGHLEVALLQDDVLVAAGWGVPLVWDGTVDGLPGGYSDALARAVRDHEASAVPDTFVLCAAQVRPDAGRTGLAAALVDGLLGTARAAGLARVIAPLRPTTKHRYPLTPVEDYVRWTRDDGSAFDPWLRTHLRTGARLLGTSPASQTFTGTVDEWQDWSGLELPGDGAYVVPDALAPLHVERAADRGTCVEPAIWIRHR
jgi:GNAT superfamily N-acetyltransferase